MNQPTIIIKLTKIEAAIQDTELALKHCENQITLLLHEKKILERQITCSK